MQSPTLPEPTTPPAAPAPSDPVRPLGPMPGTGSGSRPGGPDYASTDPTGLRYDRSDLDDTSPAGLPPGVDGWPVTGRRPASGTWTVQVKECCGAVLVGEECDCAEIARQMELAPVIVMRPFDLPRLAAEHITAAEVARRERGAA